MFRVNGVEFARNDQLAHGILDAGFGEFDQNPVRRVGAQSRQHGAVDLAVAKGEADFERAAQLANVDGVFQADAAQQDSRQIVRGRAEARHAESFAAQFFDAVDLGLRPTGADRDDWPDSRPKTIGAPPSAAAITALAPATAHLDVAADQRRHHHRARRNENEIRLDAVLVKAPISFAIHKPTAVGPVLE